MKKPVVLNFSMDGGTPIMKHQEVFFFSAKEPLKKWLFQIPVPGFMLSCLPAEIFAGIATISVRVADVLKHTAVNLELIDTRDLANVKKMSLDLLY